MSDTLLHICSRSAWDDAQTKGGYRAASLDTEGFIHCSMPDQVVGTANLLFRGQQGLVLLVIDGEKVSAPIRFENVGNGQFFPNDTCPQRRLASAMEGLVGTSQSQPRTARQMGRRGNNSLHKSVCSCVKLFDANLHHCYLCDPAQHGQTNRAVGREICRRLAVTLPCSSISPKRTTSTK